MKPIHYMSSLFAIVWLSHFEYDVAEIEDHEEVQKLELERWVEWYVHLQMLTK